MKISVYGANWESAEGWHPASDRLSSKPDRADCQSAAGCQPAPQKPLLLSYGAETTYTQTVTEMFATYPQVGPGLQYADQRWYNPQVGKFFLSPDPGGVSTAKPKNPTSWNRFLYANGDPVNFLDPRGGIVISAEQCAEDPDSCEADDWNSVYGIGGTFGGSDGGSGDEGGGDNDEPEPAPPSRGNAQSQSFVTTNFNASETIAASLSIDPDTTGTTYGDSDILALSSVESNWGTFKYKDKKTGQLKTGFPGAWFGMHGPLPGETTCAQIPYAKPGSCVAEFSSFLAAGEAFANSWQGQLVVGVSAPSLFFGTLQSPGKFGWDSKDPVLDYVTVLDGRQHWIDSCVNTLGLGQ